MAKFEMGGVQELARWQRALGATIDGIADDGMVDGGQMYTYLVRASGLQLHLQQRAPTMLLQHAEARARLAATTRHAEQPHAQALAWIASDRRVDYALGGRHRAFDQREIALDHRAVLHLLRQRGVRRGVFRHDQQSRRILVQPVDDAGTRAISDAGERWRVGQQRIDQRARR